MKVTIQFDHIQLADNASYREIYRAISGVMRENWPDMAEIPAARQQLVRQRAASSTARHLFQAMVAGRRR